MTADTYIRVRALVANVTGLEEASLGEGDVLGALLDSLEWVDLLQAIEGSFEITIADNEAIDIDTVGQLYELVVRKLDDKGEAA